MYFKQSLENYRENLKKSVEGPIHENSWGIYFEKEKDLPVGYFAWYPNREAFEKGLIDEVPSLTFEGSKKCWAKQRRALLKILKDLPDADLCTRRIQLKVNQSLRKSGKIIWMGTYRGLKSSPASMTEFVRGVFRGNDEDLGGGQPIDLSEDQNFKDFLLDYSAKESQEEADAEDFEMDDESNVDPEEILAHLESLLAQVEDDLPGFELKQLDDDEDGHQVFSLTGKLF